MEKYIISVVVPIYKVEKYIKRCIDSILMQTFTEFELLLIDDGSPDKCSEICNIYAQKDSRVTVIHKKNGGLSDARNAGIELFFLDSDLEWITFIDSDDWIHSFYLKELYSVAMKTKTDISVCSYCETDKENPKLNSYEVELSVFDPEDFYCNYNVNAVVAWGKLYKKELFNNIRYPVGKLHEDEFTTYRLLFINSKISWISGEFYYYFIRLNSITQSQWSPKKLDALEAFCDNIKFFKKNNYRNAYIKSINKLEYGLSRNSKALKDANNQNYDIYFQIISKYYRRLLKYGREYNMYPFSNYKYYYEIAYPKTMKYFWIIKMIIDKFLRR